MYVHVRPCGSALLFILYTVIITYYAHIYTTHIHTLGKLPIFNYLKTYGIDNP